MKTFPSGTLFIPITAVIKYKIPVCFCKNMKEVHNNTLKTLTRGIFGYGDVKLQRIWPLKGGVSDTFKLSFSKNRKLQKPI